MLILLDPGHGFANRQPGVYDPGAVGQDGAEEASYTLNYALKLREELIALGAEVQMTRTDAVTPCSLLYRIRLDRTISPALFCSIHFNASAEKRPADGKIKGFQVLWRTPESEGLAKAVASAMEADGEAHQQTDVIDRPDLAVLSTPKSVLVEIGFIDDLDDRALIDDFAWMGRVCKVIASALTSYVQKE